VLDAFDAIGGADGIADVALLEHVAFGADLSRIHAACDAYVPLHPACDGHERLARAAGSAVPVPEAAALQAVAAGTRRATA
jgi:hypothetical protein